MRRKSAINIEKRRSLVEGARRMTPEQRLATCVSLAKIGTELRHAGESHRRDLKSTGKS